MNIDNAELLVPILDDNHTVQNLVYHERDAKSELTIEPTSAQRRGRKRRKKNESKITAEPEDPAQVAPFLLIAESDVVLGDNQARDDRTTLATTMLRDVKREFQKRYFGRKKANWIPEAMQEFRKSVQLEFAQSTQTAGRVLLRCRPSVKKAKRVKEIERYGFKDETKANYGIAVSDEDELEQFLRSRDSPELSKELDRYRKELDKLQHGQREKFEPKVDHLLQVFAVRLIFFEVLSRQAFQEKDEDAKLFLKDLSPRNALKHLWERLDNRIKEIHQLPTKKPPPLPPPPPPRPGPIFVERHVGTETNLQPDDPRAPEVSSHASFAMWPEPAKVLHSAEETVPPADQKQVGYCPTDSEDDAWHEMKQNCALRGCEYLWEEDSMEEFRQKIAILLDDSGSVGGRADALMQLVLVDSAGSSGAENKIGKMKTDIDEEVNDTASDEATFLSNATRHYLHEKDTSLTFDMDQETDARIVHYPSLAIVQKAADKTENDSFDSLPRVAPDRKCESPPGMAPEAGVEYEIFVEHSSRLQPGPLTLQESIKHRIHARGIGQASTLDPPAETWNEGFVGEARAMDPNTDFHRHPSVSVTAGAYALNGMNGLSQEDTFTSATAHVASVPAVSLGSRPVEVDLGADNCDNVPTRYVESDDMVDLPSTLEYKDQGRDMLDIIRAPPAVAEAVVVPPQVPARTTLHATSLGDNGTMQERTEVWRQTPMSTSPASVHSVRSRGRVGRLMLLFCFWRKPRPSRDSVATGTTPRQSNKSKRLGCLSSNVLSEAAARYHPRSQGRRIAFLGNSPVTAASIQSARVEETPLPEATSQAPSRTFTAIDAGHTIVARRDNSTNDASAHGGNRPTLENCTSSPPSEASAVLDDGRLTWGSTPLALSLVLESATDEPVVAGPENAISSSVGASLNEQLPKKRQSSAGRRLHKVLLQRATSRNTARAKPSKGIRGESGTMRKEASHTQTTLEPSRTQTSVRFEELDT